MNIGGGRILVAELPMEHLAIYSKGHRLAVFWNKGTECACCLEPSTHLAITTDKRGLNKSINLFTDDWVMMTVDHIIAQAKGGRNSMENYQPLCQWCNLIKGDKDLTIEELREFIRYKYRNVFKFAKNLM